jgi:hypothetical protein
MKSILHPKKKKRIENTCPTQHMLDFSETFLVMAHQTVSSHDYSDQYASFSHTSGLHTHSFTHIQLWQNIFIEAAASHTKDKGKSLRKAYGGPVPMFCLSWDNWTSKEI